MRKPVWIDSVTRGNVTVLRVTIPGFSEPRYLSPVVIKAAAEHNHRFRPIVAKAIRGEPSPFIWDNQLFPARWSKSARLALASVW